MPQTVLLVDDEVYIPMIVGRKLRQSGYEVIVASNGRDAIEILGRQKPDLIVSDFQMPAMSGAELAKSLAGDPETSRIPIIFLTARGFLLESEITEIPAVKHLVPKPFSANEILQLVDQTLRASERNAEAA